MDKAYIVGNEQREKSLLAKLEQQGCSWNDTENTPPTEWHLGRYPYAIVVKADKKLLWTFNIDVTETEIVYDGRKEEHMSEKYIVSQEFMNSLNKWRENLSDFSMSENFVGPTAIDELDDIVDGWWNITDLSGEEQNSRLIAILSWVNGEDVFEVEKPKKWVVRSKKADSKGSHLYVFVSKDDALPVITSCFGLVNATHFATKEEAQSWANNHQEVVEVN